MPSIRWMPIFPSLMDIYSMEHIGATIYNGVLPNLYIGRRTFKELHLVLHKGRSKNYKDLKECISNFI